MTRVALAGASGFLGGAIHRELARLEHEVVAVPVPRLNSPNSDPKVLLAEAKGHLASDSSIEQRLAGCQVLINAAGNPDASSGDRLGLLGANALTPALLGLAAGRARVRRVVHISSAVVQGDASILDDAVADSEFSAYSASKVAGERVIERLHGSADTTFVIFRPPSVHSPDRRVSILMTRIAQSHVASVAGSGNAPSPQALVDNVAAAVVFLAASAPRPPLRVHYPSEGLTTGDVMRILGGGKEPVHLPTGLALTVVRVLKLAGRRLPRLAANARRVEILWLGQAQATSWLCEMGWSPPVGREGWVSMARILSSGRSAQRGHGGGVQER